MDLTMYAIAVVSAVIATSFTDWFFGGVLFHDKYLAHPEVWRRPQGGAGEKLAVTLSTLLGIVTCAVFVYLSATLGILGWGPVFGLAFGVWLLGPLPALVTNALFIKIHPLNVFANSTGWLVKLLVCAACAHLFLG